MSGLSHRDGAYAAWLALFAFILICMFFKLWLIASYPNGVCMDSVLHHAPCPADFILPAPEARSHGKH